MMFNSPFLTLPKDQAVPYSSWQPWKLFFAQKSLYLQGILSDINEQDTSFLDCKHKHMMKSGAPPNKVVVLHCLLHIEFHGFTSKINYHYLVPGLILIFRDDMGPFNLLANVFQMSNNAIAAIMIGLVIVLCHLFLLKINLNKLKKARV